MPAPDSPIPWVKRLGRAALDAAEIWRAHPPRLAHAGKIVLFDACGGSARVPVGKLGVTRFAPAGSPRLRERGAQLASVDGAFDYAPAPAGAEAWWVNFANAHLFCAYGAAAFAQDEIQVAEHPVLASVREALVARGLPELAPRTSEGGRPTPILVRGAERFCAIDTSPDLAMPYGIYGRRFARATPEAIRQAVTRLPDGSTVSNIVAMEAPQGSGRYTAAEIGYALSTAATAFAAVILESSARPIVHAGHWGTGAYGGDKVLMAVAQLLAARFAGLTELVVHSVDDDGDRAVAEARRLETELARGHAGERLEDVALALAARGFTWGVSDGN